VPACRLKPYIVANKGMVGSASRGFLGYDPFPRPSSIPERLIAKRRLMGWSIAQAAREIGVDPSSWGDWERGGVILFHRHRKLVARLLGRSKEVFEIQMTLDRVVLHVPVKGTTGTRPQKSEDH